jgi:hypothetical protein
MQPEGRRTIVARGHWPFSDEHGVAPSLKERPVVLDGRDLVDPETTAAERWLSGWWCGSRMGVWRF